MPSRTPRPRGPQGGKKRPPIGITRRTASVELARYLGELKDAINLQKSSSEFPEHIAAELMAIDERMRAGTWKKADVERARQLHTQFAARKAR